MLTLSTGAALWFLVATAPVAFVSAFNDLKRMKLPNALVLVLVAIYVISGPFVLSFDQYLWGFAHGVIMYGVGMFLFMFAGVGAGDGKFAAAMSMFIPLADAMPVLMIFCAFLLGAFTAHRILRAVPAIRRATPDWVSWGHNKFPMGLALAGTLITYFAIATVSA
ncbi:A24 family peptidase [Celeribacter marinus]|uniref:A24 family peptidase n=1 Tax=Celeribacter marinus TaxID=1397108 RepID=UPI003F6AA943